MASYYDLAPGETIASARMNLPYDASGNLVLLGVNSTVGTTTTPIRGAVFDNGATDGGALFFNGGTTSFLKSSADGLSATLAGFTTLTLSALTSLAFSAASTISILDNSATALSFKEATNNYMVFDTTNAAEKIKIYKNIDISNTAKTISLLDNNAAALDITEAANSYLKFVTTNSSEGITAGYNITSPAFTYSSAQTRYYQVMPQDFVVDDTTIIGTITFMQRSPRYLKCIDPAYGQDIYRASIHLPQGASITNMNFYYYRDDAASFLALFIARHALGSEITTNIASITASSIIGQTSENVAVSHTVDNSTNTYLLYVAIHNNNSTDDCYLEGVVLTYTITAPLP